MNKMEYTTDQRTVVAKRFNQSACVIQGQLELPVNTWPETLKQVCNKLIS
jgi:hypothetical protein